MKVRLLVLDTDMHDKEIDWLEVSFEKTISCNCEQCQVLLAEMEYFN